MMAARATSPAARPAGSSTIIAYATATQRTRAATETRAHSAPKIARSAAKSHEICASSRRRMTGSHDPACHRMLATRAGPASRTSTAAIVSPPSARSTRRPTLTVALRSKPLMRADRRAIDSARRARVARPRPAAARSGARAVRPRRACDLVAVIPDPGECLGVAVDRRVVLGDERTRLREEDEGAAEQGPGPRVTARIVVARLVGPTLPRRRKAAAFAALLEDFLCRERRGLPENDLETLGPQGAHQRVAEGRCR